MAVEQKKSTKEIIVTDVLFSLDVPAIQSTPCLEFRSDVTFFMDGNDIKHMKPWAHKALGAARELTAARRFKWRRKTGRCFFLRAEDFFNLEKRILQTTRVVLLKDRKPRWFRVIAKTSMPILHGESFLEVFESRLESGGFGCRMNPKPHLHRF